GAWSVRGTKKLPHIHVWTVARSLTARGPAPVRPEPRGHSAVRLVRAIACVRCGARLPRPPRPSPNMPHIPFQEDFPERRALAAFRPDIGRPRPITPTD